MYHEDGVSCPLERVYSILKYACCLLEHVCCLLNYTCYSFDDPLSFDESMPFHIWERICYLLDCAYCLLDCVRSSNMEGVLAICSSVSSTCLNISLSLSVGSCPLSINSKVSAIGACLLSTEVCLLGQGRSTFLVLSQSKNSLFHPPFSTFSTLSTMFL